MQHQTSRSHIESELKHTQIAEKHGREIEQIGIKMQACAEMADAGAAIRVSGQKIQELAKLAQHRAERSLQEKDACDDGSAAQWREWGTAIYCQSVREHVKANRIYLASSQAFSEMAKQNLQNL
jgi:hypothetical protein